MLFGFKNVPSTFHRLINYVASSVDSCEVYINDIIAVAQNWTEIKSAIREMFCKSSRAHLTTINLPESEFVQATVTYLSHILGRIQKF